MDETVDKNKLYVGNLPFKTTEEDLLKQFEKFDVEDGEWYDGDQIWDLVVFEFQNLRTKIWISSLLLALIALKISYFSLNQSLEPFLTYLEVFH